jgi:predicted phage terminase large subunit-like protein
LNESGTVTSVGSTFDNAANLSASFLNFVKNRYGNSAFGRQELYGELIFESPGALWRRDTIKYVEQLTEAVASEDAAECCTSLIETERNSARHQAATKDFARVVIGVDPAVTYNDSSDETGIVVMARGLDGKGYVLDDCSGRYPPSVWSSKVVQKYHDFQADLVVAEVNQGGDLVLEMLRSLNRNIPFSGVRATRGKVTRAEPIASLYERGLILHMRTFPKLEDQLCEYVPGEYKKSPDRLDALVWAATELFRVDELRQNVMVLH